MSEARRNGNVIVAVGLLIVAIAALILLIPDFGFNLLDL